MDGSRLAKLQTSVPQPHRGGLWSHDPPAVFGSCWHPKGIRSAPPTWNCSSRVPSSKSATVDRYIYIYYILYIYIICIYIYMCVCVCVLWVPQFDPPLCASNFESKHETSRQKRWGWTTCTEQPFLTWRNDTSNRPRWNSQEIRCQVIASGMIISTMHPPVNIQKAIENGHL